MDSPGFEPGTLRMRSECDTTTPQALAAARSFLIPGRAKIHRWKFWIAILIRRETRARKRHKKLFTLLDLCVSSLRRGHANLLCIIPILTDDSRRRSASPRPPSVYARDFTTERKSRRQTRISLKSTHYIRSNPRDAAEVRRGILSPEWEQVSGAFQCLLDPSSGFVDGLSRFEGAVCKGNLA